MLICFGRVLEYVGSGRNKDVVDPDQNLIYTRRKQRQEQLQAQSDTLPKESTVKLPTTGWPTSKLATNVLVYQGQNGIHISQSGKTLFEINRTMQFQQVRKRQTHPKVRIPKGHSCC